MYHVAAVAFISLIVVSACCCCVNNVCFLLHTISFMTYLCHYVSTRLRCRYLNIFNIHIRFTPVLHVRLVYNVLKLLLIVSGIYESIFVRV